MIERVGRKPLLLYPFGVMAVSLVVVTVSQSLQVRKRLDRSEHFTFKYLTTIVIFHMIYITVIVYTILANDGHMN